LVYQLVDHRQSSRGEKTGFGPSAFKIVGEGKCDSLRKRSWMSGCFIILNSARNMLIRNAVIGARDAVLSRMPHPALFTQFAFFALVRWSLPLILYDVHSQSYLKGLSGGGSIFLLRGGEKRGYIGRKQVMSSIAYEMRDRIKAADSRNGSTQIAYKSRVTLFFLVKGLISVALIHYGETQERTCRRFAVTP